MKTLLYNLVLLVGLTAGSSALAAIDEGAACCQVTTSLATQLLKGGDTPGDERFFKGEGAPPNIHFLLDTSCSMQELPQVRNGNDTGFYNDRGDATAPAGCRNQKLEDYKLSRGWDHTRTYDPPDPGVAFGSDAVGKWNDQWKLGSVYRYAQWGDSQTPGAWKSSYKDACESVTGKLAATLGLDEYDACYQCLNEEGYYRPPGADDDIKSGDGNTTRTNKLNRFIFSGNFMRFNPPKYISAIAVFKQIVKDVRRVRMGFSTFDDSGDDKGAKLRWEQNPGCKLSLKEGSDYDNNRASLVNNLNGTRFLSNTPVAEALLDVGLHFTSGGHIYTDPRSKGGFDFSSTYVDSNFEPQTNGQKRGVCWGCQTSAVIVISDGQPTSDSTLPFSKMSTVNGGRVTCPDEDGNGVGDCKSLEDDDLDGLDDVAKLLYENDLVRFNPPVKGDLNSAGKQSLITYTIAFGVNAPILKNAAKVGGGEFYEAEDGRDLKDKILQAIASIEARATSFAAASVTSLQVNRTGGSVLPRFKPATGARWDGFLYRFELGTELLVPEGRTACDPEKAKTLLDSPPGAGDPNDFNQDGDCNDVMLYDADKDPVLETDEGLFVKLSNPDAAAKPFWEANQAMKSTAKTAWKTREIWTIVDNGSSAGAGTPDNRLDRYDTPIKFHEDNAGVLREYLGIADITNPCPELSAKVGETLDALKCTQLVIRYLRGADAFSSDPAKRELDRDHLLADIFHSAPVVVDPPSPRFFCGFDTQCLVTLFRGGAEMSKDPDDDQRGAYDMFLEEQGGRDRIVLVGSNDGLIHAFHNGALEGTDATTSLGEYGSGTGKELWAFMPPDQLPKLLGSLKKHMPMADGTAMVREAWFDGFPEGATADPSKDGTKNYTKEAHEYRTVGVFGMGEGGIHRMALDLTHLISKGSSFARGGEVFQKGDFLWTWPQPCDDLSRVVGDSYGNFSPNPPPIGPVALANEKGQFKVRAEEGEVAAEERWVVLLNGGYDQNLARGRGLAFVDLKTGATLWNQFHGDTREAFKTLASNMLHPFVAVAAMDDHGHNLGKIDEDLLFDTATIGDYGGTIWTLRFHTPGAISSTKPLDLEKLDRDRYLAPSEQIQNWFAARSFRVKRSVDKSIAEPFSYMVSNAFQTDTGYLRTFIGSGDRFNIIDSGGPNCRLSNLGGCARLGCDLTSTLTVKASSSTSANSTATVTYDGTKYTSGSTTSAMPSNVCEASEVKLAWNLPKEGACSAARTGNITYKCLGESAGGACVASNNNWGTTSDNFTANSAPTSSPNWFYGFHSYGVKPERTFNNQKAAEKFDLGYGTGSRPMDDSDLTDITTSGSANPQGPGWKLHYGVADERTGSGSNIVDGCVLWNSFEPQNGGAGICSTTGTNIARLFQANFVTGEANCSTAFRQADGKFARYHERTVVAIPGEPAVQRSVYDGSATTGIITLEAGGASGTTVSENKDLVQAIYHLEVDRADHDCRHVPNSPNCK